MDAHPDTVIRNLRVQNEGLLRENAALREALLHLRDEVHGFARHMDQKIDEFLHLQVQMDGPPPRQQRQLRNSKKQLARQQQQQQQQQQHLHQQRDQRSAVSVAQQQQLQQQQQQQRTRPAQPQRRQQTVPTHSSQQQPPQQQQQQPVPVPAQQPLPGSQHRSRGPSPQPIGAAGAGADQRALANSSGKQPRNRRAQAARAARKAKEQHASTGGVNLLDLPASSSPSHHRAASDGGHSSGLLSIGNLVAAPPASAASAASAAGSASSAAGAAGGGAALAPTAAAPTDLLSGLFLEPSTSAATMAPVVQPLTASKDASDIANLLGKPDASVNSVMGASSLFDQIHALADHSGTQIQARYQIIRTIGVGAYGKVHKVRDKEKNHVVALKEVSMADQVLNEIKILRFLKKHPNIVGLEEVFIVTQSTQGGATMRVHGEPRVALVFELLEHDLLTRIAERRVNVTEAHHFLQQLLNGVAFMHKHKIFHRDIKSSNLLIGSHGELKICDFGTSGSFAGAGGPFPAIVTTLWYRSPENLLGATYYDGAVDLWAVGCVMAEMFLGEPLMNGTRNEVETWSKAMQLCGVPTATTWPEASKLPYYDQMVRGVQPFPGQLRTVFGRLPATALDMLSKLLCMNPATRISAEDALKHPYCFNGLI